MRTDCHPLVSESLRGEQHHICCYCESKVPEQAGHMEHMEPRSVTPSRTYDYTDLAISCNGGKVEHCGHYKDNRSKNPNHPYKAAAFRTPHDPNSSNLYQYLNDGAITPRYGLSSADGSDAQYMIKHLGLDSARLTERRKQHATLLVDTLGTAPDLQLIQWLIASYLTPNGNNHLEQFPSLSQAILCP
jgi:uncharacterized protein (TIGR02646 family)